MIRGSRTCDPLQVLVLSTFVSDSLTIVVGYILMMWMYNNVIIDLEAVYDVQTQFVDHQLLLSTNNI